MPETVLKKGSKFPVACVNDVFNTVKGKSTLAILAQKVPVKFNGNRRFTFAMDGEVNFKGENDLHSAGKVSMTPVDMVPIEVEYGARVSKDFMHAAEEEKLEILKEFNEGFAGKLARGLDIGAFHGVNPRTGNACAQITQHLDKGTKTVSYDAAKCDDNVDDAIALIGDYDVTGIAMAKTFSSAMSKLTGPTGAKLYPELKWGGQPKEVNGVPTSVNSTVSYNDSIDEAIVGDFANAIKWGYAKDVEMEVIPYGDPDNTKVDLQAAGQVYIRATAYIGWAIMDENAFARIVRDPEAAAVNEEPDDNGNGEDA